MAVGKRLRRMLPKLAALFISVFASLLIGEVMVRILMPQNLSGSWRAEVPRGYFPNKDHGQARQQFDDRVVYYRFNEYRMRGGPVSDRGDRILVLGDSYTFGALVDEDKTFVHLLDTYAARDMGEGTVQILNGGAGGWGTANYLAYLEDYGDRIKPKAVVVFMNYDDIDRCTEANLYTLSDTADESSLALTDSPPIHVRAGLRMLRSAPPYNWLLEHSHLVQLVRNVGTFGPSRLRKGGKVAGPATVPTATPEEIRYSVRLGRALFHRMHEWCSKRDIPMIVLTTGYDPEHGGPGDPVMNRPKTPAFMAIAPEFFKSEGIPFKDLSPDITKANGGDRRGLAIPNEGHANEKGNELIALFAWPWLKPQIEAAVHPGAMPTTHPALPPPPAVTAAPQ